jgi:hypothetical protein
MVRTKPHTGSETVLGRQQQPQLSQQQQHANKAIMAKRETKDSSGTLSHLKVRSSSGRASLSCEVDPSTKAERRAEADDLWRWNEERQLFIMDDQRVYLPKT